MMQFVPLPGHPLLAGTRIVLDQHNRTPYSAEDHAGRSGYTTTHEMGGMVGSPTPTKIRKDRLPTCGPRACCFHGRC
jgi:hypothetical protein